MRIAFSIVMAAGLALAAPARADLLISNVVIVSPERSGPSGPVSIYVDDDGRIAEVSPRPSRRALRARQRLDGTGRFLAPGLIDGHTHLDEVPGMLPEHEARAPEVAAAARRQIPLSYLYHGFTTVVDLNGRPDTIAAWNAAPLRPQAWFCGGAPVLDGYPTHYLPKPERYRLAPYFLYDPAQASAFPAGADPADHTPEAAVARMRRDGAICVKTHYEPGFGQARGLPLPTLEMIRRLVAAARASGMPTLLHANSAEAQAFGVEAGVDAFAHGIWKGGDDESGRATPEALATLDEIARRRIGWQPTFGVLYGERDLFDPDFLTYPELARVVPRALIEWYATEDGGWWQSRMLRSDYLLSLVESGRWPEIDASELAQLRRGVAYLATRNARLLFGSDTPSDPTFANPPGLNGRDEMRRWIEAGVTPAQLFRAATIENARFYGLDDSVGTIAPGKRADLLLLRSNPMTDASAYDLIDYVIVAGRPIERASLAADRD